MRHVTLALALALAGCSGSEPATAPTADRAETSFIDATAAHLCAVQSRVYPDPSALAAAYQSSPQYPGLSEAQVGAFRQRLAADAAFAGRLAQRVQATCGAHPTPS
jgi:hypothetical protein